MKNTRSMFLNHKDGTIELTKKFDTLSSRCGSDEYKELQQVRRDYPNYRVVVVSRKSNKNPFDGMTYDFMVKYIKGHDDADKSIMKEFLELRAKDELSIELNTESASYAEIRDWFLETYPEIVKFHEDREAKLEVRRQNMAKKKEARIQEARLREAKLYA